MGDYFVYPFEKERVIPTLLKTYKGRIDKVVFMFIRRAIRVWPLLLLLIVFPRAAHRLSRERLPSPANRIPRTPNPLDDFEVIPERCTNMPDIDMATIVMKGSSFDVAELHQLKPPIYLLGWRSLVERDGVWYGSADVEGITSWLDKGLPVLCVEISCTDEDGQDHIEQVPKLEEMGSDPLNQRIAIHCKMPGQAVPKLMTGLACVIALSKLAKRVDVYGWDFYLKSSPNENSLWRALWNIFISFVYVESTMYNLHYAHRLSQLSWVKVHGRLGDMSRHKRLVKCLERVYYSE